MIVAKDFYLLRTPLLPIQTWQQLDASSPVELEERVKDFFADPYLQEAIYIASPELFQEFEKWQQQLLTNRKDADKLLLSLLRYIIRMTSRCTPYGLFAGCATGGLSAHSHISLCKKEDHRREGRLDMNYVAELTNSLIALPEIQEQLKYYPNNSLYKIGDTYRYAEFKIENKFRSYHLTAVDCSSYLEKIIITASCGARLTDLAAAISTDEIDFDEAKDFVSELVANQILVSELEPTITGEEFFSRLVRKMKGIAHGYGHVQSLQKIQSLLADKHIGVQKYFTIREQVEKLMPGTKMKDLVQTDLFLETKANSISTYVINEIRDHVEKLWSLSRLNNNADLQQFRNAFRERYEGQEIPLLLALDAEAGIGYAGFSDGLTGHSEITEGIITESTPEMPTITWNQVQDWQLRKLLACMQSSQTEIVITDKDLEELKGNTKPVLPNSFYVMGSLLGSSPAAIDSGDFQFDLHTCGGPSVANLLGRFCHGDEQLLQKVNECLREEEEQQPDCIFAEIVHLPEARTGNVLLRPELRAYEIVYLSNSTVPEDRQIPLTDLMVSVEKETIILRSKKMNKRVIPRLSTAHNYNAGCLPAYKFLCDLQSQNVSSGFTWQWGVVRNATFLPRVRYGKMILSKRTWILEKKEFPALAILKEASEQTTLCEIFNNIRETLRLPQFVTITEGDNTLLINMHSEVSLMVLASAILKKDRLVLKEFLGTPDQCFVQGEHGSFTNELIIPFSNVKNVQKINSASPQKESQILISPKSQTKIITNQHGYNPSPQKEIQVHLSGKSETNSKTNQHCYNPGSEWLYVKIYCGTHNAEKILKEVIKPLTAQLRAEGIIDKWFFLRYADPENHLRVRFHHATDKTFWKTVMQCLHESLQEYMDQSLVHKIQLDTYKPERHRYGTETMELSEQLFYHDSEAVVRCIDLLDGEAGETYRWMLACRGIDQLLNDFSLNLQSKASVMKGLQQSFFKEFGSGKPLSDQLNDKYRQHMRLLASCLDETKDAENSLEEVAAIFSIRSKALKPIINNIKTLKPGGGFQAFIPSYIHMFVNRVFLSGQRKHELVLYHFLGKYYDSQIAINKKQLQTA